MKAMEQQTEHIKKCRTCLGQRKGLQPLTNLSIKEIPRKISYAQILQEVANINVLNDKIPNTPQYICIGCLRKLKSSYAFIKQAQEINGKLESLLKPSDNGDHKLDCLEEPEMCIQKCLEIKLEPVSLSEQLDYYPAMSFNDNTSVSAVVKEEYITMSIKDEIVDKDYDGYIAVVDKSKERVVSSESDADDREDKSSIDLENQIYANYEVDDDETSKEYMEKDCSQPMNASKNLSAKRPFCTICGSSFSFKSDLVVHMRRHTGEKPHPCDICGKAFTRAYALTSHRRVHTGEKPFGCQICGKSFRVSHKLTNHMRSHTDDRPFQCTQCERSFKYPKDLKMHKIIHSGERPYSCNVCGDTFPRRNSLKVHQTKQHPLEMHT